MQAISKGSDQTAYAQAVLRHCLSHTHTHVPHSWKSHVTAHMIISLIQFYFPQIVLKVLCQCCFTDMQVPPVPIQPKITLIWRKEA